MTVKIQSILGLPIHELSMHTATNEILRLHNDYQTDLLPRYIATVNVDFLTNTWGWTPGNPRHPELLNILRQADLITADGMPLIWMSRLLGSALPERVTGADLVWVISKVCAEQQLSMFILGAQEELTAGATHVLLKKYPNLKIAGSLSPFIQTEGKSIVDAEDFDEQLVEKINNSGADVLLICLGNPKQELWFHRVRHRLKVPVSIGIGGALNFVVGKYKRAPRWARESGLEWLFRLAQEPRRLWKRYVRGGFKLACLALPLLCLQSLNGLFKRGPVSPIKIHTTKACSEEGKNTKYEVLLPSLVDMHEMQALKNWLVSFPTCDEVCLDFSQVQMMNPEGLGVLLELARKAELLGFYLSSRGIHSRVALLLKLHQVYDLFNKDPSQEGSIRKPQFDVTDHKDYKLIRVQGKLKGSVISREEYLDLMKSLERKPVLIDLSQCSFIDSNGLSLLLKMRRRLIVNSQAVVFYACSRKTYKALRMSRLEESIAITDTLESAKAMLDKGEILVSPLQRA